MENVKQFGSDVCDLQINTMQLKIIKNLLEKHEMPSMKNTFSETDIISSEEFMLGDFGEVFSMRTFKDGTPEVNYWYEGLESNGEYISFRYFPFIGKGLINDTIFRHCDTKGNMLYCRQYTDQEIVEMLHSQKDFDVTSLMAKTLYAFDEKTSVSLQKSDEPQKI